MTRFKTFALAGAGAIALAATPTSAAEVLYSFSSLGGTQDFTFTLDVNPTPDAAISGLYFYFDNVAVTTNGSTESAAIQFLRQDVIDVQFLLVSPSISTFYAGPQLYSGNENSPTMLTGVFAFSNGTLSVTDVSSAAVPEPGTWAMMLFGFGAIGWSLRVRGRKFARA